MALGSVYTLYDVLFLTSPETYTYIDTYRYFHITWRVSRFLKNRKGPTMAATCR